MKHTLKYAEWIWPGTSFLVQLYIH